MTRRFYELRTSDVGKPLIRAFGRTWCASGFIGRVLPGDVGKRVYLVVSHEGDYEILHVENDMQRDARIAKTPA